MSFPYVTPREAADGMGDFELGSGGNMTNSSPSRPFQEDDARWCYVEHHVEVCVR